MGAAPVDGESARYEIYGFDLDDRDSDGTHPEDCGIIDGVSSDGRRGIDNTIAGLWSEDFAPRFLASETELGGSLVSVIRLSGVDSFDSDDCVDVAWVTDDPQFRRARIDAGRLIAEGSAPVPVRGKGRPVQASSSIPLIFSVSSPRITFRPSADALTEGLVGGSMTVDQLDAIYRTFFSLSGVSDIAHPDLPADGQPCALLSAGFAFEATAVPTP